MVGGRHGHRQLVQQPKLPGRVDERIERRLRRRPAGRRQRRRPRVAEVEVRVVAEQAELPAETPGSWWVTCADRDQSEWQRAKDRS